jgi:hypothetical protein
MPETPDELRRLAESLMRRREWRAAAEAFELIPPDARDVGRALTYRLSRNLAALEQRRPAVYDLLVALPAQQQYSIGATAGGRPTVNFCRPDGSMVSLSGGPDPLAAVAAALPRLYQQTPGGEGIGLCGLGDGYLLQLLAQHPPALFMDKRQPVFLIEPEPQVLLQCLMIHDLAGAAGPIEDARFHWFVGPDWDAAMQRTLLDDPFLPCPSVTVGQGFDTEAIQAGLGTIVQRLAQRDARFTDEIDRHYTGLAPADFAARFRSPGRPPRVLLLTTRFSTVLQYSTRDTAAAFERLGWQARVVIEPSTHHRVLRSSIAAALAEFKPDLVFQIDHLRHEHQGLFPGALPFACWIQDHLPHLASREVGRQVGPLDFVLTDATATYVGKFSYPARQCIPLPKLVVRTEAAALDDAEPADDIVFVSNASGSSETMIAEAVSRYARNPHTHGLITRCCGAMVEAYGRGESLPTYSDVCAVLRRTLDTLGLSLPTEGFDALARWLTHPFNDALYRQQALRWAAEVARNQGRTLALYGRGWEKHPEFAPYTRGAVEYGEPLRRLTRRSRINLQIVPYLCLHQRLLDGLMAGGFFLIRTHPADVAPAELLRHVHAHGETRTAELEGQVRKCRPCLSTTGDEDLVAMVREWEEAGQLTVADGPLPMLGEVGFHDAASLGVRVAAYCASPAARGAVVARQRRSISSRLSYDVGIRRVVGRMRELLDDNGATFARRKAA